ncbi:MAG: hypothetical protein JSS86_17355 [Cyanobacteria bacterium SZAS LIN-2]|nr:hypothetical protein [Cyanobacteria bacterium SZAS LIN-3]MBS1998096.1 hypothetical protein [Cyanobacteria bacterium SZAS LIN-2]MBS2006037.1 hypothetical protein [Cyanobacteria bacterium SZAS TMP-1]
MNFNDDKDCSPSPNLLPFGGFEVARLLSMMASGDRAALEHREEAIAYQPLTANVHPGWLRSKILAG